MSNNSVQQKSFVCTQFKCQAVLFDPQIGYYQMQPFRVRVDLGAEAMQQYFTFIKAPILLQSHIRLFSVITGHPLGGGLISLQRWSRCILQPQPTGLRNLSGATTRGQSGPRSNDNEGVFHFSQTSRTGASPSDYLMSYTRHSLRGGGSYHFYRDPVWIFYQFSRLGCWPFREKRYKISPGVTYRFPLSLIFLILFVLFCFYSNSLASSLLKKSEQVFASERRIKDKQFLCRGSVDLPTN